MREIRSYHFERGGLIWIFNFHPTQSFVDYRFGVLKPGKYKIILDTDSKEYGGHGRITVNTGYFSSPINCHGMEHSIMVYIPCRTALCFVLDEEPSK